MTDPWKRKEQIGECTLYLGDCLQIFPTIKADSVITDPPYGIDFIHKELGGLEGDKKVPDVRFLLGVGNSHIIWGGNHFADQLPAQTRWLMWLKHDPVMFQRRNHGSFDLAWTDLGGSCRAFKNIWDGSIREGDEFGTKSVHPTQKPIALMEWCVRMTTGMVVDPYMGSGTTGVACARQGRSFIGIEIDPAHYQIALDRIALAYEQPDIFDSLKPPEQVGMEF